MSLRLKVRSLAKSSWLKQGLHGKREEQAGAQQILAAPRGDYTMRLLAAIPRGYQSRPEQLTP